MEIIDILTKEFNVRRPQVENTLKLIDEGNTIPFIARYRKEVTGSLDDTVLRDLNDRLIYLRNLEKRREEVKSLIAGQDKLTSEIEESIDNATTLTEIEDIYRPFKPHRKTRASVARERGLEDLALMILLQQDKYDSPLEEIAAEYVNEELGVDSSEAAIAGACDIIAEDVSDNAEYRKQLRSLMMDFGSLVTKQAKKEPSVYELYYDYSEKLNGIPPHRILAINRGEKEDFLKVSVEIESEIPLNYLFSRVMENPNSPARKYVASAVIDSYERLIAPSIEREIRTSMMDDASENSIRVFSVNLRNLLMQSPLKGKVVLGYDPGYRTGCKLAIVDRTGKVIDTAVIYPTKPHERIEESKKIVKNFIRKYEINAIAIGNGTASKESEIFIADVLREIGNDTKYIIVNEAGASVYSASKLAADEFPDFDVTQRSAVSIARRLQDPLAELVKIDPKSIGVGQYQHDMKQARLDEALGGVVENCVNSVGVDLNTASHSLLSYIAGINATIAKNIVKYREENGEFSSRAQILNVPRLGAKAYEQCAGFLRVTSSDEILDHTGVHPESYGAARKLLKKFKFTGEDVKGGNLSDLRKKAESLGTKELSEELGIGEPTLLDIIGELEKPGRDIRDSLPPPMLRTDVMDLNDLKPDMLLKGTVRNVIDFGAFVDIGVHQDGLVHISEMSDKFIAHPSAVLSVGDQIYVRVKSVDVQKKRIALILKGVNQIQA